MGPLVGVKVLDLSRVLAGPWATQCMADFGADVIKVEKPGGGDDTRAWGPPWFGDDAAAQSAYFLSANRGKQSLAIDITDLRGSALVQRLSAGADVVIENFKVGGLKKYGLDYERLQALNPRLVYCSITGFGQTGPMADLPGYDAMIQAQGGIMSLTGVADGEPGAGPQKVGVAVADLMTGMYAVSAILAAMISRNTTGVGQHIDLALLDTQVAWLANQAMNYLIGGQVPTRLGTAHPNIVPYQSFKTADGHLALAVGNDSQFTNFANAVGQLEWTQDTRFATNAMRVKHREALVPMCQAAISQRRTDEWLEIFAAANVPCGPINDLARVFQHPQVQHRELKFSLPHASGNAVPQVKNPVRFSETPLEYLRAPPTLGQHTRELLQRELALSDEELNALFADGVIA